MKLYVTLDPFSKRHHLIRNGKIINSFDDKATALTARKELIEQIKKGDIK